MLHVYDNSADMVIAEFVEDAWKVWCETTGEKREDYEDMEWTEEPDDALLTIRYEEYADLYGERPENATVEAKGNIELVTATHAAWIKLNGRGFLCSTEW